MAVPSPPLRVLFMGETGGGKTTTIRNVGKYHGLREGMPVSGHGQKRGTTHEQFYRILQAEFVDTAGKEDIEKLDDAFHRGLQQNPRFADFDVGCYCYRPGVKRLADSTSGLTYAQMYGPIAVLLLICQDADEDEEAELRRLGTAKVEAEGLTVRATHFLPTGRGVTNSAAFAALWARLLQFQNTPRANKVQFTAPPLSTFARTILTQQRAVVGAEAQLHAAEQAVANAERDAAPREVAVFNSAGMGNDTEHHAEYDAPAGRTIVGTRAVHTSVNDGDRNGFANISKVSATRVRVGARMPKRRGNLFGSENQWLDATFIITHVGSVPNSLRVAVNAAAAARAAAKTRLEETERQCRELANDINANKPYYNHKFDCNC